MSQQTESPTGKAAPRQPEAAIEEKQLDQVTGGACATGVHLKEATITHRKSTTTTTIGGS